jgi:hypothetical protein
MHPIMHYDLAKARIADLPCGQPPPPPPSVEPAAYIRRPPAAHQGANPATGTSQEWRPS